MSEVDLTQFTDYKNPKRLIWFDTEFISAEVSPGGDVGLMPISIGAVTDQGHMFYAECSDAPWDLANDFVIENVKPHLHGDEMSVPLDVFAQKWIDWLNVEGGVEYNLKLEMWSYCPCYDDVLIRDLCGPLGAAPDHWPYSSFNLEQEMARLGVTDEELPPHPGSNHNALGDALWHRDIWLHLKAIEREKNPS